LNFNRGIFKNEKVLVTGHTGFKGSWLITWLSIMGAKVYGISNNIPTNPSIYETLKLSLDIKDIRLNIQDSKLIIKTIEEIKPKFIFHLAAQPIVKRSYDQTIETYLTNTIGSVNILEGLRKLKNNCIAILITSDKVYDNKEWVWGYREFDKIGGQDPYSASKGCAELVISSYFRSFFKDSENIQIAIGRAGNVIGGGDWAENRIIPDCIKAWERKEEVKIRNPNSTRPWQHVLEPLSGYLTLAQALNDKKINSGEAYNFGPLAEQNRSVKELVLKLNQYFPNTKFKIDSEPRTGHKESSLLKLNCDKSFADLGWLPKLDFDKTTELTAKWYSSFIEKNIDMKEFTINQILEYINL
tara:strand:- start:3069 stop:4136 length:1068 start_codon:yes stop_codon:yes gene_type:complete